MSPEEEYANQLSELRVHMREAVEHGVGLLNRAVGPDWVNQIDLDDLDLASACNCVVGQLYGRYGAGADVLEQYLDETPDEIPVHLSEYGFVVPAEDDDLVANPETRTEYVRLSEDVYLEHGTNGQYEVLTGEWKSAIRALREE